MKGNNSDRDYEAFCSWCKEKLQQPQFDNVFCQEVKKTHKSYQKTPNVFFCLFCFPAALSSTIFLFQSCRYLCSQEFFFFFFFNTHQKVGLFSLSLSLSLCGFLLLLLEPSPFLPWTVTKNRSWFSSSFCSACWFSCSSLCGKHPATERGGVWAWQIRKDVNHFTTCLLLLLPLLLLLLLLLLLPSAFPVSLSVSQSIDQSMDQSINLSIYRSIDRSINLSV